MVLFEYEYRDTFLHKMNPFTKIVMVTCISLLATVFWDIRFILPLTITSFVIAWKAKVPISWIKLLMILWFFSIWVRVTQSVFMTNPELFKVLPPEVVTKEIVKITPKGFPIIGETAITYGSLYYLLAIIAKGPITWTLGLVLIYTTSLNDILEVLKTLKFPPKLLFIIMAAWRFLSLVIRSIENITKAQRLRGWELRSRNPKKILQQISPFVKPFARQLAMIIDTVSLSVELRCFGAGKISYFKRLKLSIYDKMIIIILPVITIILWYLTLIYYIGLI